LSSLQGAAVTAVQIDGVLHRCHRRALQRGQQDASDGVPKGHAKAAFQRFGDDGRDPRRIGAWLHFKLIGLDQ